MNRESNRSLFHPDDLAFIDLMKTWWPNRSVKAIKKGDEVIGQWIYVEEWDD